MSEERVQACEWPSEASYETYPTVLHPERYSVDWEGYYRLALQRRSDLFCDGRAPLGMRYGPMPEQIVNAHMPSGGTTRRPMVLYLHGGRWREGHPDLYDHLAKPWVDRGAVFLSCGYRKEPESAIADAVDDVCNVISWARDHAADFDADPDRITVVGHSSGGHMVAMACMTLWADERDLPDPIVSAAICVSAPVDLRTRMQDQAMAAYLSPVGKVVRAPVTTVVAFGEPELNRVGDDDSDYAAHGRLLAHELAAVSSDVRVVKLANTDHICTATAISDVSSPLFTVASAVILGGSWSPSSVHIRT